MGLSGTNGEAMVLEADPGSSSWELSAGSLFSHSSCSLSSWPRGSRTGFFFFLKNSSEAKQCSCGVCPVQVGEQLAGLRTHSVAEEMHMVQRERTGEFGSSGVGGGGE